MIRTLLEGLSLIDATGFAILATTAAMLALGILANLWLRTRYAVLERDLRRGSSENSFTSSVLRHIVRDAAEAARRPGEPNTQAIIEECVQADLRLTLLGGVQSGQRHSRSTRRPRWAACWAWTARPRSRPCAASWNGWPLKVAPSASAGCSPNAA